MTSAGALIDSSPFRQPHLPVFVCYGTRARLYDAGIVASLTPARRRPRSSSMSQPVGALPPSALWTDARVFASTFLDVPPSFSWRAGPSVNGALDTALFLGSDPSWLATALFTPPPQQQHTGTQASRNSPAGVSERSAETERQKAETRRLYSRDELLAFRQQQQSGHTCVSHEGRILCGSFTRDAVKTDF
jgi:hypothetical protein